MTPTADTYSVWTWGNLGGGEAYCTNTSWPGDAMSWMGQTATGNNVYKYVITKVNEAPQYLIISHNGGNTKVYDGINFVNHGYYVEGQTDPIQIVTATSTIHDVTVSPIEKTIYTFSGQCVQSPRSSLSGFYICNGKKILIRP